MDSDLFDRINQSERIDRDQRFIGLSESLFSARHPAREILAQALRARLQVSFGQLRLRLRFRACEASGLGLFQATDLCNPSSNSG
jgi:hypothetical protein